MADADPRADPPRVAVRGGIPRSAEVSLALLGLVASLPVLGVASVVIVLTSRGPELFRQERVGKGGEPFILFKLRTMRISPGGPEVTARDDVRLTPFGKLPRRAKLTSCPSSGASSAGRCRSSASGTWTWRICGGQRFSGSARNHRSGHPASLGRRGVARRGPWGSGALLPERIAALQVTGLQGLAAKLGDGPILYETLLAVAGGLPAVGIPEKEEGRAVRKGAHGLPLALLSDMVRPPKGSK